MTRNSNHKVMKHYNCIENFVIFVHRSVKEREGQKHALMRLSIKSIIFFLNINDELHITLKKLCQTRYINIAFKITSLLCFNLNYKLFYLKIAEFD